MSREANTHPNYEILAYITLNKDRIITGNPLCLYVTSEEEQKEVTLDIAKAMKADIVRLKNKDYMVLRS